VPEPMWSRALEPAAGRRQSLVEEAFDEQAGGGWRRASAVAGRRQVGGGGGRRQQHGLDSSRRRHHRRLSQSGRGSDSDSYTYLGIQLTYDGSDPAIVNYLLFTLFRIQPS
jgi:hypothetical protein